MSVFPGAIPPVGSASASDTLAAAGHTALHNANSNEINALATKVGTGSSTPASGLVLRSGGAGTSAWAQVGLTTDVTGVLPTANGGTGTTLLTFPSAADTLVGRNTIDTLTNKTLATPVIGSFVNATHNHQNAAGGGTLLASAITSLDLANTTLSNPYKFSVYRNAAQNSGNAAFAKINFDTEIFDTNNNFDSTVNFRYTAPVPGFYQFNAQVSTASGVTLWIIAFYKNGVEFSRGTKIGVSVAVAQAASHSDLIQLAAGEYVEAFVFSSGTVALEVGAAAPHPQFSGFLVSTT